MISVIIPVYNAERWLLRCIDSVLSQSYKNIEVLLIDDGSTDMSPAICDSYASKDPRVKVFHKPNGGVASARQVGIDNLQGDYVIHADADDWMNKDMLQTLMEEAQKNNADVTMCDFTKVIGGGGGGAP